MKLLMGLLLNLAAITAVVVANHHDTLTLRPSEHPVVRYINDALIIQCHSAKPELKLHWKSPKGEIINEHKGRIHIEQSAPEQVKLVFTHISLADKGNWTCEEVEDANISKSFSLIVYQKITFTENTTILTVKDGTNATIFCEVKGEPQPNITWNFNGQPITVETDCKKAVKFCSLGDGLFINKVTENDTGEYTCRAFQVNPIASDMQERTILMKIEHKPHWAHKHHTAVQYAYINGTTTIKCESIAEPPATFIWHCNKTRLHNDKHYNITTENYISTLTINVHDGSVVFGQYRCRAKNNLGAIERATELKLGTKPPPPTVLKLRGFNSNTFDVDVGSTRTTPKRDIMDINGFHIEYMTEQEFKNDGGKWLNPRFRDFPFEDGATFLINNLEPNTTYLMRAATRNLAGQSDFTKIQQFPTLTNNPPSASARLQRLSMQNLIYITLVVLTLTNGAPFAKISSITNLTK